VLKLFSTDLRVNGHGDRLRRDEREADKDPFRLIRRKENDPGAGLKPRVKQTAREPPGQIGKFHKSVALHAFLLKPDQSSFGAAPSEGSGELLQSRKRRHG
jgi:hypothetical protein